MWQLCKLKDSYQTVFDFKCIPTFLIYQDLKVDILGKICNDKSRHTQEKFIDLSPNLKVGLVSLSAKPGGCQIQSAVDSSLAPATNPNQLCNLFGKIYDRRKHWMSLNFPKTFHFSTQDIPHSNTLLKTGRGWLRDP